MESGQDPRAELEARVQRIQNALGRTAVAEDRLTPRERRREEKRLRREARHAGEGTAHGVVYAAASAVMVGFAITQPHLWWMVFPAFGMAMSAARAFSAARRAPEAVAATVEPAVRQGAAAKPALEAPQEPSAPPAQTHSVARPVDPRIAGRLARVDGVIEKLLGELRAAPRSVRELIRQPEETVAALRAASHELARREEGLRAMITAEEDQRLRQERSELETRVAAQTDAVVRARLLGALEALDAQLASRTALATAAERIEAEGTRILYTLENLRANVLRMSTADSTSTDLAGDGVRDGLEQLSHEMDAVAKALEEVHATELGRRETGVVATSQPGDGARASGAAAARARGVTAG